MGLFLFSFSEQNTCIICLLILKTIPLFTNSRWQGRTRAPGKPITLPRSFSFWTNIPSVSWSKPTMSDPSKCNRSVCPLEVMPSYSWQEHHDAQGHPRPLDQQSQVGVLDEQHQGKRWFRLHKGGFGQHQGHAFGQQSEGPRQGRCPCSFGRTGSRPKHWIGSRKDLFLPSFEYPYQDY